MTVDGVLETALYVDDPERSSQWYARVFGFPEILNDHRLIALSVADRQVLLLFRREAMGVPMDTPGGRIPDHGGAGALHLAFAIDASQLELWRARLNDLGVAIESEVRAPRGGTSLYFRDPDGHCVEIATRGLWSIY